MTAQERAALVARLQSSGSEVGFVYKMRLEAADALEADGVRLAQQDEQIAELGSALLDVQRYALDFGHNHAPSHAGHECRLCWICKRVAAALSVPTGETGAGT